MDVVDYFLHAHPDLLTESPNLEVTRKRRCTALGSSGMEEQAETIKDIGSLVLILPQCKYRSTDVKLEVPSRNSNILYRCNVANQ